MLPFPKLFWWRFGFNHGNKNCHETEETHQFEVDGNGDFRPFAKVNCLVVSTHLKKIVKNGNLPQVGVKIRIFETTT